MKKILKTVFAVVLALALMLLPAGCAQKIAPTTDKKITITAEAVDSNLKDFLGVTAAKADGERGSRFYGSPSEKAAAQFLFDRYSKKADYPNVTVSQDEFKFNTQQNTEVKSQNVTVRLDSKSTNKQIVIGTHYDNGYGTITDDVGSTSFGAIENATAVAALMSMVDYFSGIEGDIGVSLVFVFFGSGSYSSAGPSKYLAETMTVSEIADTLLMVNLYRFGGDNLYAYSDEVKTPVSDYLLNSSAKLGLGVNPVPKNIPIIEQSYVPRIPYTHYAMLGNHAPFMERYIPVANLFGGNVGSFNLSDIEHWGSANLGTSKEDTYTNLVKYRPNYATQAADAATLLTESFKDAEFIKAANDNRQNPPSYEGALQTVWVYVGVIGLIILLVVLIILLVRHFEKKYPFVPPVKKLKIAVFGMDYEKKTEQDIFVDIKKPRNPFDGY